MFNSLQTIPKLALLATVLLIGCATPYSTPEVVVDNYSCKINNCDPNNRKIRAIGMLEVLNRDQENEDQKNIDKNIDVILVHGMGTHDEEWVERTNNMLLQALGSDQKSKKLNSKDGKSFGNTKLYQQTFDIKGKKLWTHSIVWSGETIPYKEKLCYDRDDDRTKPDAKYCTDPKKTNRYIRASFNQDGKNKLMNDSLSDALIYVGPARHDIRKHIGDAIIAAAGARSENQTLEANQVQAEAETAPLFIISESLGSKMLFDALIKLQREKSERVTEKTYARITQVFMGANQIPILSLATQKPTGENNIEASKNSCDSTKIDVEDPLSELEKMFKKERHQRLFNNNVNTRKVDQDPSGSSYIVAFTDPNDLLSYPLNGSAVANEGGSNKVDVLVSNDNTYFLRTIDWFGLFGVNELEHPLNAHMGYRDNSAVLKIIACGIPTMANCPM